MVKDTKASAVAVGYVENGNMRSLVITGDARLDSKIQGTKTRCFKRS